ncbi:MAG TPA: hypothetical protein DHU55_03800 [Blastocatellia bacterium]|nr:hypothetical protein [Blastocatellia bacterium]
MLIPEVVGDAALLFDPAREDELTDILMTLPHDTARHDSLMEKASGARHNSVGTLRLTRRSQFTVV